MKNIFKHLVETQIWKSIFRYGYEDTLCNRSLRILDNLFLHLHPAMISRDEVKSRHTWCMGGITFLLFIIVTITGVLLMFYYHPHPRDAYWDIKDLGFTVPFGGLLRNIHRWAGHLMVITVMLHMFRVFMTGSYKPPREFNWVIGVILLISTLFLSFTGYLLPWDQLGFWAITVGTNMAGSAPVVGHEGPLSSQVGVTSYNDLRFALLGGSEVGENALLRAYVWHCVGLPIIAMIFMAVHFWRVRKDNRITVSL